MPWLKNIPRNPYKYARPVNELTLIQFTNFDTILQTGKLSLDIYHHKQIKKSIHVAIAIKLSLYCKQENFHETFITINR